jgi:hypothetical protein
MIRARETIASPMLELAEMLLNEQPRWLASFLRLACMEGEEAAIRLYGETVLKRPSGPKAAQVDLGSAIPHTDGESVIIPVRWRVQGYRVLPGRFEGRLEMSPREDRSTQVDLFGNWALDPRDHPDFATRLAARAAAETAIQRMLGHLRVAIEESARTTV